MEQKDCDEMVANVALRAEKWWHDTENSLRSAVHSMPVKASVKDWIGQAVVQGWVEGAITSVQEYGDEMRAIDAEFDRLWGQNMIAVNAWRAAHPGNDLVMPDMGVMLEWLLREAGIQQCD